MRIGLQDFSNDLFVLLKKNIYTTTKDTKQRPVFGKVYILILAISCHLFMERKHQNRCLKVANVCRRRKDIITLKKKRFEKKICLKTTTVLVYLTLPTHTQAGWNNLFGVVKSKTDFPRNARKAREEEPALVCIAKEKPWKRLKYTLTLMLKIN